MLMLFIQKILKMVIKLMNPPVNGFSVAVREGVMKCLEGSVKLWLKFSCYQGFGWVDPG
jgi:hypothetical protein